MGLHSMGGYVSYPDRRTGVRVIEPIYDWTDNDIWLAHKLHGWDYCSAYDVMHRHGVPKAKLRLGPPTMNAAGGESLRLIGSIAWPDWWNRVCRRLPSVRTYAKFGKASIEPQRRLGESWEECFWRACVDKAPQWIADRAEAQAERTVSGHSHHSAGDPLPQASSCHKCSGMMGSWRDLTMGMYLGDPFSASAPCPSSSPSRCARGPATGMVRRPNRSSPRARSSGRWRHEPGRLDLRRGRQGVRGAAG